MFTSILAATGATQKANKRRKHTSPKVLQDATINKSKLK